MVGEIRGVSRTRSPQQQICVVLVVFMDAYIDL